MKRNTFFKAAVMMMVMMMTSVNTFGRGREVRSIRHDMRPARIETRREIRPVDIRPAARPIARPVAMVAPIHRVDRHGYLPGWDRRVRYVDGRWGYLRGDRWMWYNTYFEPDFYFAHPVAHFTPYLTREGAAVAAGVATGVAVGALVAALCH